MKLLKDYLQKQQELFDYFGYVENWKAIPVDNATMYVWQLITEEDGSGEVRFANSVEQLLDEAAGDYYSNEIYTQRHLEKWVYRGADYTLIVVDTHTDGNKFLQIFDNSKETTNG
jgi:hypothetical protein